MKYRDLKVDTGFALCDKQDECPKFVGLVVQGLPVPMSLNDIFMVLIRTMALGAYPIAVRALVTDENYLRFPICTNSIERCWVNYGTVSGSFCIYTKFVELSGSESH